MKKGKPVVFKRTNELDGLVRRMAEIYFGQKNMPLDRKELRSKKNAILVQIEAGVRDIRLNSVAVRD